MPRATSRSAAKSPFSQRDERVLARARRREEVDAELAAHDPGLGLRRRTPRCRSARRSAGTPRGARSKLRFEPLLVAVERVGVLHDELADAQQPAARPRLVAILRREVVPDLRQLLVRLDLARMEGERLLVRHRQDELPAAAVLEVEELRDRRSGRSPPRARPASAPGTSISWPPIASISSRMICSTFRCTRQPSGRNVQRPALDLADEAAADEQLVARRPRRRPGSSRSVGGRAVMPGRSSLPRRDYSDSQRDQRRPRPSRARPASPSSAASAGACRRRSTGRSRGRARRSRMSEETFFSTRPWA